MTTCVIILSQPLFTRKIRRIDKNLEEENTGKSANSIVYLENGNHFHHVLSSRKTIKGVIMSTGKMKVLVVSGFLGAGKRRGSKC